MSSSTPSPLPSPSTSFPPPVYPRSIFTFPPYVLLACTQLTKECASEHTLSVSALNSPIPEERSFTMPPVHPSQTYTCRPVDTSIAFASVTEIFSALQSKNAKTLDNLPSLVQLEMDVVSSSSSFSSSSSSL